MGGPILPLWDTGVVQESQPTPLGCWGGSGSPILLLGVLGWPGGAVHGGDVLGVQAAGQSGEQELESLVLKLSVLKDFLSSIEKKVQPEWGGTPVMVGGGSVLGVAPRGGRLVGLVGLGGA